MAIWVCKVVVTVRLRAIILSSKILQELLVRVCLHVDSGYGVTGMCVRV